MNETSTTAAAPVAAATQPTTDPSLAAGTDVPATPPVEQPATPTIAATSEYDNVSTYQPTFKVGTTIVEGVILDFAPAVNQESGEFQGWRISFALAKEAPDDSGGMLPIGHRCGPFTIFTQPSQYRSEKDCISDAMINLQGLNGIVRDKKSDPRFERADGAFQSLAPHLKLPGRTDTDAGHYEQWKNTLCKFVVTRKVGQDGTDRVNLNAIMAASTPDNAVRR